MPERHMASPDTPGEKARSVRRIVAQLGAARIVIALL